MRKIHTTAFTLVELIIVITILAILATIAFTSYQGHISSSRDSTRLATISEINSGLDTVYARTGFLPDPENATSYTGANSVVIKQGDFGDLIARATNMTKIPTDPLTNSKYKYSIFKNGKYYQVAIENEKQLGGIISGAYADNGKIPLIKGNYKYDPTLPSLFVVASSVTSSGIFDGKTCFVINGGNNSFSTPSSSCVQKQDISGKSLDTGLIGYWDMETLSGTTLKDFSGNGNDLYCIDRNGAVNNTGSCAGKISSTGSIGKSMAFSQDGVNISNVAKTYNDLVHMGTSTISYNNGFSISFIGKEDSSTLTQTFLYHTNFWEHRNPVTLWGGVRSNAFSGELSKAEEIKCSPHPLCINNLGMYRNFNYQPNNFNLHTITFNSYYRYYINGNLIYELPVTKSPATINNSPLYIGGTPVASAGVNGYVDEFKLYNRELSSEEIAQQARISGY